MQRIFRLRGALMNIGLDAKGACYVAYYGPGNLVLLYPDNGEGAQATSSSQGSSVAMNGNELNVSLSVTFKPAFGSPKGIWTATSTLAGQFSSWQAPGRRI